jgi:hypothetical protein
VQQVTKSIENLNIINNCTSSITDSISKILCKQAPYRFDTVASTDLASPPMWRQSPKYLSWIFIFISEPSIEKYFSFSTFAFMSSTFQTKMVK